jgi:UDP-N-acetylglucosamine 2-epimerase (non-hydrolysing)
MKILSVVGARPNFMKIAPVLGELRHVPEVEHLLVHSGQHYDQQLSGNFFDELALPMADVNLQVGSGSHAEQTAEVMKRLEPVLVDFKPDLVIVVGDINSTMATAITAAKLNIRIAHIEAGLRSFDSSMPEEVNRRVTDALSDLLFVSEESGVRNLRAEGVPQERIFFVGNVMIDTLLRHREVAKQSPILETLGLLVDNNVIPYSVLTLHRPSNVDHFETLDGLLSAVHEIAQDMPVLFPIHPRTMGRIKELGLSKYFSSRTQSNTGLISLDPMGYLEFLCLMDHAALVMTDSGGIQEETTVLNVPCLTLRENTERPATVEQGTNQIVGTDSARILKAARSVLRNPPSLTQHPPLWDGKAAQRIVEILAEQNHLSVSAGHRAEITTSTGKN